MFDRHTKEKVEQKYQLLIIDGYFSYVNIYFMDYVKKQQIIMLVLSSHTIH